MNSNLPKELLFFPEIGKVEIVRTQTEIFELKRNRLGQIRVFVAPEVSIYDVRRKVEQFIQSDERSNK